MNIPIEQGRLPQTEKDIVVDNVWQEMQKKDVIGMNLYSGNTDYTICGISAPFRPMYITEVVDMLSCLMILQST